MESETLKPCPFCGGDAETEHYAGNEDGPPEAWVRCGNVDCEVNPSTFGRDIGDAIAAWNRRAEPVGERPEPTNLQVEPSYPAHDTVLMAMQDPEMTAHQASNRCSQEGPHSVGECGEFVLPVGEPVGPTSYLTATDRHIHLYGEDRRCTVCGRDAPEGYPWTVARMRELAGIGAVPPEPVGEPVGFRYSAAPDDIWSGWWPTEHWDDVQRHRKIHPGGFEVQRVMGFPVAPPAAPEAQEPERPWFARSRWNALAVMAGQIRCRDNPEDLAFGTRLLTMMAEVETIVPPVSASSEEERDG